MMLKSTFDALGTLFRGLANKILGEPPREVWNEVLLLIRDGIEQNFLMSQAPDGQPWAPLKYRQGKALIKTGRLMLEALKAVTNGRVTPSGVEIEMIEPAYGAVHQFGAGNIPARPFMGMSEEVQKRVLARLRGRVVEMLVDGMRV